MVKRNRGWCIATAKCSLPLSVVLAVESGFHPRAIHTWIMEYKRLSSWQPQLSYRGAAQFLTPRPHTTAKRVTGKGQTKKPAQARRGSSGGIRFDDCCQLLEGRFVARPRAIGLGFVRSYEGLVVIDPSGVGIDGLRVVKRVVGGTLRNTLWAKCTVAVAAGVIPPKRDVALIVKARAVGIHCARDVFNSLVFLGFDIVDIRMCRREPIAQDDAGIVVDLPRKS